MKFVFIFVSIYFLNNLVFAAEWNHCPFDKGQSVKPTQRIELERDGWAVSPEVDSNQVLVVVSEKWKTGECEVLWRGTKYKVDPNYLLAWNSTVDLTPMKIEDQACPIDDIKSGKLKWNNASAEKVVRSCEVNEVEVVVRENKQTRCTPKKFVPQNLSASKTWEACNPPVECPSEILPSLEGIEKLYFELDSLTCRAARNPKRQAEIRSEISKFKGPGYDCLQQFKLPPTKLVVHHSAMSPLMGPDVIQRSHMEYRDFADIGYHYVISQTPGGRWRLFEGRPIKYIGAHAGAGLNRDSIGIVIAGNYQDSKPSAVNPTADKPLPPPEALILLEGIVLKLMKQYPIQKIYTHNEVKSLGSGCSTECPSAGPTYITHKISEKYLGFSYASSKIR